MIDISIVTATFNSATTLKDCLESVKCQTCPVEHIVIDGGSFDKTKSILESYPHISRMISESDNGIYDAMNKGISMCTGEIVGILNSDDFYADNRVVERVLSAFEDQHVATCYGDLHYVDPLRTDRVVRNWRSGRFDSKKFYWGWMPPHPTFFVRREIYIKYGMFNLNFGSAADYELMLRFLVKQEVGSLYIPEVLVNMRTGGASNASFKKRIIANRMDRLAWNVNGLKPYPWTTFVKPLRKINQFLCI